MLAHEIAHVLQRRNAGGQARAASLEALETEADTAARAVASGTRATCRLADPGGVPRAWGEAGHYYTALYVMLAAGMDKATAATQAFYAQMPDQVIEFDATRAGARLAVVNGIKDTTIIHPPGTAKVIDQSHIVQEGLHCLNGGNAEQETSYRSRVLIAVPIDSLEFGLAIHPFGDSYAHRVLNNQAVLYSRGAGHLVDGTTPDDIGTRAKLYVRYGTDLFDIILKKREMMNVPYRMEKDALAKKLDFFANYENPWRLLAAIREDILFKFNFDATKYFPEAHQPMSWDDFRCQYGKPFNMYDAVMRDAWIWAHKQ